MASGSSGRANNSGSKGFDFGKDDILCSYEDYANQDLNNVDPSDHSIADNNNSAKEMHKSRMARSSVYPTATYNTPEESSYNQDVIAAVEGSMKKYADNLMRFLEGISSRLSQLELYCYNLDKSIGEMRSDLVRDHGESESKLKSLDNHVQEVHRSVQILRDKQELLDTQKELAKLQLAKESSSADETHQNEEKKSTLASETQKSEKLPNEQNGQQLALALPHQVAPQPSLPAHHVEQQQPSMAPQSSIPPQNMPQQHSYYMPPPQTSNLSTPSQPSQAPYLQPQPQMHDPSRPAQHPTHAQLNPGPQVQSLPPYPQQWAQQPVMQPQIRPPSQPVYPYPPNQSPETSPNNMPMQVPYPGTSQPGSGPEAAPYAYGTPGRSVQAQPPPQHIKSGYGDGYGPRPAGNAYMMYEGDGGRAHQTHPHFQQGIYPPSNASLQNPQHVSNTNPVAPQSMPRGHPHNELIEKLVGMGFRGDHVVAAIKRLEESGEPIDFNAVLDRLNGVFSGSSQRGWSG